MKEIKIIQDDSGKVTVETIGEDGQPQTIPAESAEDAIEQVKGMFGGIDEAAPVEGEPDSMTEKVGPVESADVDGSGPIAASKGKKMEDNVLVDKKKIGMRPKVKADWSDYGAM